MRAFANIVVYAATPPPAVQVEVVADSWGIFFAILGAAIAAVAAIATWRAALAAREATEVARDAYLTERSDRRMRQASLVYGEWKNVGKQVFPGDEVRYFVEFTVRNSSDAGIFNIQWLGLVDGVPVTNPAFLPSVAPNEERYGQVATLRRLPDQVWGKGIIAFTDTNGIRWRREAGQPPVEFSDPVPTS